MNPRYNKSDYLDYLDPREAVTAVVKEAARQTTEAATTVKGDLKVANNFKDISKDDLKMEETDAALENGSKIVRKKSIGDYKNGQTLQSDKTQIVSFNKGVCPLSMDKFAGRPRPGCDEGILQPECVRETLLRSIHTSTGTSHRD